MCHGAIQADLVSVYTATFTSAGPINPYPYNTVCTVFHPSVACLAQLSSVGHGSVLMNCCGSVCKSPQQRPDVCHAVLDMLQFQPTPEPEPTPLQKWQFEYQWFTLFYELFIFLWVSTLVIMPSASLALCPVSHAAVRACAAVIHGSVYM